MLFRPQGEGAKCPPSNSEALLILSARACGPMPSGRRVWGFWLVVRCRATAAFVWDLSRLYFLRIQRTR
jgi:hypothetical protein